MFRLEALTLGLSSLGDTNYLRFPWGKVRKWAVSNSTDSLILINCSEK